MVGEGEESQPQAEHRRKSQKHRSRHDGRPGAPPPGPNRGATASFPAQPHGRLGEFDVDQFRRGCWGAAGDLRQSGFWYHSAHYGQRMTQPTPLPAPARMVGQPGTVCGRCHSSLEANPAGPIRLDEWR